MAGKSGDAQPFFGPRADTRLRPGDLEYLSVVQGAQVVERAPAAMWAIWLMLAALVAGLAWASVAQVDIITKAKARVIPDGKEQIIASLEGGILREMLVREGQTVEAGQELALLDPTRFEAQQAEGQTKRIALLGTRARLEAEANGRPLRFPDELKAHPQIIDGETESFQARQRALAEAVEITRKSGALLAKELAVAEQMSAKGLMSEVEVMRVRRQVNDLNLQVQERVNRFRQDASAELVRVRTELSLLDEQIVVREDALRRTALKSPVKGIVRSIKANTVGGVVTPGSTVMEILPLGPRVLIEARVPTSEIGFVKVGQPAEIKLSAYDYTVFGILHGTVVSISPDALGDPDRGGEAMYYRTLVRADHSTLQARGQPLPVLPGMAGSAEIRTGQRTVLGFLLRPMLKTSEAFRER